MLVYMEHAKESTKKLLELMFSNVTLFKINIKKSIVLVFLYSSNKQLEIEI